jgi:hypothetical protein
MMFDRKRPPPILACDAACGALSRDVHALDRSCAEDGCAGTTRPLESAGLKAHVCRYCRGTGRAEDGGEAYRCSACGGDGWRIVKHGRVAGKVRMGARS